MKRLLIAGGLCAVFLVILGASVWGEVTKSLAGQVQPFVIDITQSVPVQVSVPISAATMTLPLTVSVSLRVKVDTAAKTAQVETLPAPTPIVALATVTPITQNTSANPFPGVPYMESEAGQIITLEGVTMEVRDVRLLPVDLAVKANKELGDIIHASNEASGARVLGLMSLAITNTNTIALATRPEQGHIVVGAEPVEHLSALDKDMDGDILAGMTKKGVIIFFLTKTDWEDLSKGATFVYNAGRPFDGNLQQGNKDFEFRLDINAQP